MNTDAPLQWMKAIPVTTMVAVLRPCRPWSAPTDLAVTLRGAFGSAVMDVACVRAHRDCRGCELAADCVVPSWFDPGRGVGADRMRPYALRVLFDNGGRIRPDQPLVVEWVWLGEIPRAGLVVQAMVRAAALGLGPARVSHVVQHLAVTGRGSRVVVVEDGVEVGPWPRAGDLSDHTRVPAPFPPDGALVDLVTRVRFPGPGSPPPAAILRAAFLRIRNVARDLGVAIDRRWDDPQGLSGVEWLDLRREGASRWSQRKRQTVDLSGWVGTARLDRQAATAYADALAAAEILHVGRGVSHGLGRVAVRWKVGDQYR